MRVWVTRAQPEAEATAARLRALGCEPLVAPLLEIRPLPDAALDLESVGALAFTSRNGVRAFAARSARRDLPVYAVGDASAALARDAGFADVRSAGGDVEALARAVAADKAALRGLLLHLGPREPAQDLAGLLAAAGVAVRTAALYESTALPLAASVREAWPTLAAVLIHSPKAAGALAAGGPLPPGPAVLCISEASAAPLRRSFDRVAVARSPDERALLGLLGKPAPSG